MAIAVSGLGVLVALMGAVGIVQPRHLVALVERWPSPTRFRIAVVVRLVVGAFLLWVAPECRAPTLVRVVGIVALVAALAILAMGRERLDALIAWWLPRDGMLRSSALFALALGALMIYAGA